MFGDGSMHRERVIETNIKTRTTGQLCPYADYAASVKSAHGTIRLRLASIQTETRKQTEWRFKRAASINRLVVLLLAGGVARFTRFCMLYSPKALRASTRNIMLTATPRSTACSLQCMLLERSRCALRVFYPLASRVSHVPPLQRAQQRNV